MTYSSVATTLTDKSLFTCSHTLSTLRATSRALPTEHIISQRSRDPRTAALGQPHTSLKQLCIESLCRRCPAICHAGVPYTAVPGYPITVSMRLQLTQTRMWLHTISHYPTWTDTQSICHSPTCAQNLTHRNLAHTVQFCAQLPSWVYT